MIENSLNDYKASNIDGLVGEVEGEGAGRGSDDDEEVENDPDEEVENDPDDEEAENDPEESPATAINSEIFEKFVEVPRCIQTSEDMAVWTSPKRKTRGKAKK